VSVGKSGIGTLDGSSHLLERSEQLVVLTDSLAAVSSARSGATGSCCEERLGLERPHWCNGSAPSSCRPAASCGGACEAPFTPRALGPFVDVAQAVGGELELRGFLAPQDADLAWHQAFTALLNGFAATSPGPLARAPSPQHGSPPRRGA
jgi:hypothetical protein